MIQEIKEYISEYSPRIERNDGDERWYRITNETNWLPSVTTMIGSVLNKGKGFEQWLGNSLNYETACEKRDEAAKVGTLVHSLCERLMLGEAITEQKDERVIKRLMSFVEWFSIHNPQIIALEMKLVHKDVPYSGTPDIVCLIDGKIHLVDIKTGAPYNSHELQLTCYKALWDANFPMYPIDIMGGLYLKDSWISKVEPIYKKYKYVPGVVNNVYNVWLWQNGGNPKPKNKRPLNTYFKLKGVEDEGKIRMSEL